MHSVLSPSPSLPLHSCPPEKITHPPTHTSNSQLLQNGIIDCIVPLRRSHTHSHPQPRTSSHQFPSDIVHIPHPGNLFTPQTRQWVGITTNETTDVGLDLASVIFALSEVEGRGIDFVQS